MMKETDPNEVDDDFVDVEMGDSTLQTTRTMEPKRGRMLDHALSIVGGLFSEVRDPDFNLKGDEGEPEIESEDDDDAGANGDAFQRRGRSSRSDDGPRTYSAKFFVEFEGTASELKKTPVAMLRGDVLEHLLTPRSPDPEGPESYWKDLHGDVGESAEEKSRRLLFLGASVLSFSSGLPFSSRLVCDSSKILNGSTFLDGEEAMILMPPCTSRESEKVLLDNRDLIRNDGEWKELILSYAKRAKDAGVISLKAGETDEWTVASGSAMSDELAELKREDHPPTKVDSQTIGKLVQTRVKKELGLEFLKEARKDGLSFRLKPSRKGGWDSLGESEEESSVRHEVSAEIELYYSYA